MFSCTFFGEACPGRVSRLLQISRSTRRLERRSRRRLSKSCVKAFLVRFLHSSGYRLHADFPEEFGIYLNYVRKLGFEETPDYDFLRELFAKVMKSNNDVDDGVFDWNLLNGTSYPLRHAFYGNRPSSGGKGWEAAPVSLPFPCELIEAYRMTSIDPKPDAGSDAKRGTRSRPAKRRS